MDRDHEATFELVELGAASTDTHGAITGDVEWTGLFPKAGILGD